MYNRINAIKYIVQNLRSHMSLLTSVCCKLGWMRDGLWLGLGLVEVPALEDNDEVAQEVDAPEGPACAKTSCCRLLT